MMTRWGGGNGALNVGGWVLYCRHIHLVSGGVLQLTLVLFVRRQRGGGGAEVRKEVVIYYVVMLGRILELNVFAIAIAV